MKKFILLGEHLSPAENEAMVKTYHCTSFKSGLLSMKAEGFLAVTNKRVIFHAFGSSFAGNSVLQSEVPIEDVSGISIYKGTYFSFWNLIGAFIFSNIVGSIFFALVTGFLYIVVISMTQGSINFDTQKIVDDIQNLKTIFQIAIWIFALCFLAFSFMISKEKIFRSAFATLSTMCFGLLGTVGALVGQFQYLSMYFLAGEQSKSIGGWEYFLAIICGIYALVCFFWYSRRPTMSISIGSKGGSSTPIAISGVSSFGIFNTTASKALSAEPAEDAEQLVKELGAMLLDIQTLGDFGSTKWHSV